MGDNSTNTSVYEPSDRPDVFEPVTLLFFPALLLCLIGIPGTIKVIHFYGKQRKKVDGSTPTLLLGLAVYDMLSLVTIIPYICLTINMKFTDIEGTKLFFCHYYVPNYLARFPKYCSNFLLMVIATSRLYSVIRPHTWKKIFSRKVGLVCVLAVTFFVPLSLLPLAVEYSCSDIDNGTIAYHQYSDIGEKRGLYRTIYILNMILYFSFPLITVIICNVALIAHMLHRMYNPVAALPLTSSQARELKMTKVVVVLTCIFVVCVSPLGIFYPLRGLDISPVPIYVYRAIMPVATLLETINYSSNSLVYYIASSRFRNEVKQDVCCNRKSTAKVSPELPQLTNVRGK
ncbi:proteinase-activated receptor 1-like [Pecten maximus]|uniref:proteinase-activated receptor 1-like n=1 Tax=Pecten maximus TaxID=6579 RepID=UPI00145873E9|nr:proteinase-activated receptor 1-like [Pecten maximus]